MAAGLITVPLPVEDVIYMLLTAHLFNKHILSLSLTYTDNP